MNQKNFDYLREQIIATGFSETLEDKLKAAIQEGKAEFKLDHSIQYGRDNVGVELNFTRSKQSDMYFFNSYRVSLEKAKALEKLEQTFYINKGDNIALKEAYHLLNTRAVNKDLTTKEGQVANAWVQIDFKETNASGNFKLKYFYESYGYDLEKVLSAQPIRELADPESKSNLISALKEGNRVPVTIQVDGVDKNYHIEANPQFKTLNIYDENMQRVINRQSRTEKQSVEHGQSAKQESSKERQAVADDDGPTVSQLPKAKRRKQAQTV